MVETDQKRYADDITLQELVRLRVENERLREALHGVLNCIGNLDVDRLQYQMICKARAALKEIE